MQLLYFILINIIAAFFAAVAGLGHALIATPLALVFLSKNTVFTAIIVVGGTLNFYLSRKIDGPLDNNIFKPLLAGAILGMPFGLIVLKALPLNTLKIYVGIVSIVMALTILFLRIRFNKVEKFASVVGFICGVMQTSTSMTGPPVALLLSGSGLPKNSIRKLFATFFFWISVLSLPLYLITRMLDLDGVMYGLCAVPFMLAVGHYGDKIAHLVPHKWYRVLTLTVICASSAVAIYSGIH